MEEKTYPYGRCFVMMPISNQGDYPEGHFDKVYGQIFKPAIEEAGYEPYRVDEDIISDPIINKIFDALRNCEMALCDLSNRNPNVLYELGVRQAYNKPVVLVCDDITERIFDVSGISTVSYKSDRLFENVLEARQKITASIISTRDGNEASLIQTLKITSAEYDDKDSESLDVTQIMLKSIMSEIKSLKEHSVTEELLHLVPAKYNELLEIRKRNGMTKKEVESIMQKARSIFGGIILYEFYKDSVLVTIERFSVKDNQYQGLLNYLEKEIGVIVCKRLSAG